MDTLTTKDIVALVDAMCDTIIKNEVPFCELDSAAGDGDFGMSLAKGFRELKKAWAELPQIDIGSFLKACGNVIIEHCGGASGPIWGSAFRAAAKSAEGKTELDLAALAAMLQASVEGIQKRGGAKLGDKTLLDALIPCVETLKAGADAGVRLSSALAAGAAAAVDGAEKTKLITATKGRASYVGDRSLSYPDAGATALGVIFTELARLAA